jgi:EmrB/QacA subfamily drug resistance transporter
MAESVAEDWNKLFRSDILGTEDFVPVGDDVEDPMSARPEIMAGATQDPGATAEPQAAPASQATTPEASASPGQRARWHIDPVITGSAAHRADGAEQEQRGRGLAFAVVIAAAVMDLLDSTITQVAAPDIRRQLGGSYAVIEWVTAAYALAMAAGLLTGGRLGDLFGRRRMLLTGMAGFVAASALCAAAGNAGELIAARAAQGALGAIMLPQVFGLIRDLFEEHEMGRAFGVYGPVMGLSAMLGPIASGGLIGADVLGSGWRMIFLVNVPVGLAALVLGARLLPAGAASVDGSGRGSGREAGRASRRGRLDLPGAVLAGAAMFGLVFPLAQGHALGWPAWLFGMLAASVLVLACFAAYQVRRQRAGRTPLVEPSIFGHRSYRAGIAFSVVFVGSMGGIVMIFNVFLQNGLGFTPWHSALTTAPWAAGAFVGSAVGGIAMTKLGRRVLHAGLVVEAAGLLAIYAVLRGAGTGVGTVGLLAPMVVGGIGMGMVFVPLFDIVMAGVRPREMGSASGVLQTVNSLGMSLGIAGIGAIFFALAGGHGRHVPVYLGAAEWTALATVGLLACSFAVAFGLPRRARDVGALAGQQ